MKIHSSHLIQQASAYKKQHLSSTETQAKKDRVEISKEAREMNLQSEQVREKQIQELKQKINNGTYELNPDKTAEAMLNARTKRGTAE